MKRLILILLACASVASGKIWYLDGKGTGDFTTPEAAITGATSGDTIDLINNNKYVLVGNTTISKNLVWREGDNSTDTLEFPVNTSYIWRLNALSKFQVLGKGRMIWRWATGTLSGQNAMVFTESNTSNVLLHGIKALRNGMVGSYPSFFKCGDGSQSGNDVKIIKCSIDSMFVVSGYYLRGRSTKNLWVDSCYARYSLIGVPSSTWKISNSLFYGSSGQWNTVGDTITFENLAIDANSFNAELISGDDAGQYMKLKYVFYNVIFENINHVAISPDGYSNSTIDKIQVSSVTGTSNGAIYHHNRGPTYGPTTSDSSYNLVVNRSTFIDRAVVFGSQGTHYSNWLTVKNCLSAGGNGSYVSNAGNSLDSLYNIYFTMATAYTGFHYTGNLNGSLGQSWLLDTLFWTYQRANKNVIPDTVGFRAKLTNYKSVGSITTSSFAVVDSFANDFRHFYPKTPQDSFWLKNSYYTGDTGKAILWVSTDSLTGYIKKDSANFIAGENKTFNATGLNSGTKYFFMTTVEGLSHSTTALRDTTFIYSATTESASCTNISITVDPIPDTVLVGSTAQYSVTATGDSPTYQWQVSVSGGITYTNVTNGTGGTTATYTTPTVTQAMVGYEYRCIVSNSCPSADTSAPAMLITASVNSNGSAKYVSTTGSDVTGDGTIGNPWRTIGFATCGGDYLCPCETSNPNKLVAGDTLYIRGGTYNEKEIRLTNSGTWNRHIVIKSYHGERATIDCEFGGMGIALGSPSPNAYVDIDSLTITRARVGGIYLSVDYNTYFVNIRNCLISYTKQNDNTAGIYVNQWAYHTLIENCTIIGSDSAHANNAGIFVWRGNGSTTIRHCDISQVNTGIFYKHCSRSPQFRFLAEYNWIHDIAGGVTGGKSFWLSNNRSIVRHNLLESYMGIWEDAGGTGGGYSRIEHNTFLNGSSEGTVYISYGGQLDVVTGDSGAKHDTVVNNIMLQNRATQGVFHIWAYVTDTTRQHYTISNYNLYHNAGGSQIIAEYYDKRYTLAQWKTRWPTRDVSSVSGAPTFTNGSGSYNTPTDWKLTGASLGYQAASDGTDMGANTDSVGILDYVPSCTNVSVTANPSNRTVSTGATAAFTITATGDSPSYQWQVSTNGGSSFANVSDGTGGTSASYTTAATTSGMDGYQYRCIVSNSCPSADTSTAATLTVSEPTAPLIERIKNITVPLGSIGTFTATVAGTPTITYQWQRLNGTWGDIASATSTSYTTPAVDSTYNGAQYRLIATNATGADTSNAAILVIRNYTIGVGGNGLGGGSFRGAFRPAFR